jgi:FKBP-type peptidyl-prolyl cis-trans isomerase
MKLVFVLLGLLPLIAVAFRTVAWNSRPSSWRFQQTSPNHEQFNTAAEVCIAQDAKSAMTNVVKASVTAMTTMLTAATIAAADDPPKKKKKPKILETDLGIPYIVLKEGSGAFPQTGDLVAISYSAFLSNGTMWDSTDVKGRKPVSFIIGKKQIIPGLESVVTYLKGAMCRLFVLTHSLI